MSGTAATGGGGGAFGMERIAPGSDGKAVRLADLVRWLMDREQTVRVDAVARCLLPTLKSKVPRLYYLQKGGFGQPLGQVEWFATSTGAPGPVMGVRWSGRRPMAESLGKGDAGAVEWLRRVWAQPGIADSFLNDGNAWASHLAVSEADARACWGWMPAGEVAQEAAPSGQTISDAEAAEQWTGERLKKRRNELKAAGVTKHMKQLELESGLDGRKIRHLITAHEKAESEAAMWHGLKKKGDNVTPIGGSRESAGAVAGGKRGPAPRKKNAAR